jgi:hypothetical protein
MGIDIKIHNNVVVSSYIDDETYHRFIKQLSESLDSCDQGDYSDTFCLDNECYDGQSVLKPTDEWVRGTVDDAVNWLRLVDLFILRPHGCYLVDQHINFNEFYNSSDPVVVTLTTKDENLITKMHRFSEGVDDVRIDVKNIPQDMWLPLVNQVTGQNFDHYKYEEDPVSDGGINLVYGPTSIDGFVVKDYDDNDDIQYHYAPQFNIKKFINRLSVGNILKRM